MERSDFCRRSASVPFILAFVLLLGFFSTATAAVQAHNYPSVTLWPLAYHYEDPDESRTDVLWPIYHQKREGTHTRTAIRPLIFNYETDPERDFRQMNILWPFTHFEYEGDTFKRWIFPLYYQVESPIETTIHLWPFYGHSKTIDGTESWSTLYPFFQYQENETTGDSRTDFFWPLGRSYRQGETSGSYLFPFWWRKTEPGLSGGFVFPYFWHTTEQKQQRGIFPLWYSSRSETSETDYALLWYARHDEQGSFSTLFPLWWQMRQSNGHGFSLLIPFYWDSRDTEDHFKVVFPFYFRHDDFEHRTALRYFFPFYGDFRQEEHVRDRYYLFPLFVKIDDRENQRQAWYFLWPLVYTESTPDTFESWALPFYWVDRSPGESKTMIGGLYWSKRKPDNEATLFFPLYLHSRNPEAEGWHFFPLYSDISKPDGYRKRFWFGPLAISTQDPAADREQLDVLWPLISKSRKAEKKHARFLPFYWHDETPDRKLTLGSLALLPPYYYRQQSATRDAFHLWPFYGRSTSDTYEEKSIVWPLFRRGTNPEGDRQAWQMLLAYGKTFPEERMWGVFPLWHHQQDPEKLRDISLLHWQESRPNGDRQFSLLHAAHPDWSLFSIRHQGSEEHHHFFPLYSYSSDADRDSKELWLLGPIYRYQRTGPENSSHHFIWKVLYADKSPDKKESGFFWRLIRSKQDTESDLFEFNPFYYSEARPDGESYTSWFGGVYKKLETAEGVQRKLFWMFSW